MKPSFWKAIEALGAAGSAVCDWRFHLGSDLDDCLALLKPTGRTARSVIDPDHPPRRMDLVVSGEEDFLAMGDDGSMPPVAVTAAEAAEMMPRWESVGRVLAPRIGFDYGAWETDGNLRRIGSCQSAFGHVSPVLLFMPPGHLGDYNGLFRELSGRTEATVLFPSARWFTTEMEALRSRNRLEFIDLAGRLARTAEGPPPPLPAVTRPRGRSEPEVRALIHAGNGLAWGRVTVEISGNRTIRLIAPGQEGRHVFRKCRRLGPEHPLGILMTLAAKGEWRNPPLSSPDYERVAKAFLRLQALLRALVPLPGKPFSKARGAFVPLFQLEIHADLTGGR